MKLENGSYIIWRNEHGECIPGRVLAIRRRVKVRLNDLTGERITWVERHKVELQ